MAEKRQYSEIAMQSKAFQNLWNERPDLRGRFFAINNNSENAIKGASNKAMGVLAGVSDMAFLSGSGRIIWIEWKLPSGSQSRDQINWEQTVTNLGHTYVIVRSEDEFRRIIEIYE